jgi:hypothetical protein
LSGIDETPNDLAIVGGSTTVTVAVFDGPPGPVSVELIGPVVLFWTPARDPVTGTAMVQLALPASVPPENVNRFPPVIERVPPQDAVAPFEAVRPDGSESVNAIPVSVVWPGFVTTKLTLTVPPSATFAAENDLAIVGAPGAVTVTVAVLEGAPVSETGPEAVTGEVVLF